MADSWSTDDYNDARTSEFAQYVADPVVTLKDSIFGIPTSSWYNKLNDYVNKVRELQFNEMQRKQARDETWFREDSQYQRLVEDMKKAGLNPYWLLANGTGSPTSSQSQQASYGNSMSSRSSGKSEAASLLKTLGVLIAFLKFLA